MGSAWQSWLHPRRTARELELLRAGVEQAEHEALAVKQLCEQSEHRCKELRLQLEQARTRAEQEHARCLELKQELAEEREVKADEAAARAEIERMYSHVGDLVKRYEDRIARLTRLLSEARSHINRLTLDAEREIAPLALRKPLKPKPAPPPPPAEEHDEADWYTTPPEL